MKTTKKQVAITSDLVARTIQNLDELAVDYAVVIKGVHTIFSNVDRPFAMTILRDEIQLQDKIDDFKIEEIAEKLSAIPGV